jgi:3-phenylpropionate/trans-cinnamate dioxygenase ferredoxin subunit
MQRNSPLAPSSRPAWTLRRRRRPSLVGVDLSTFAACPRSALEPGDALRLDGPETGGVPIALFHTEDGEFYAIDDTCTHQDASLADGWLEGCEVECPLHASRFDLRTGAVDAPPAKRPVRVHAVTLDDDTVYLTVSDDQPNLPPGVTPAAVS